MNLIKIGIILSIFLILTNSGYALFDTYPIIKNEVFRYTDWFNQVLNTTSNVTFNTLTVTDWVAIGGDIVDVEGINATGHILPAVDDTYFIGNLSKKWKMGYFSDYITISAGNIQPSIPLEVQGGQDANLIGAVVSTVPTAGTFLQTGRVVMNRATTSTVSLEIMTNVTGGGVWGTGGGNIIISPNASEKMRITTGGLVGIGTNSPSSLLDVRSAASTAYVSTHSASGQHAGGLYGTAGSIRWLLSKNNDAESGVATGSNFELNAYNNSGSNLGTYIRILRASGNVGIGSTSPTTKLQVGTLTSTKGSVSIYPADSTAGLLIYGNDSSYASISHYTNSNTSWHSAYEIVYRARNGLLAPQAVQTGDGMKAWDLWGYNGTAYVRTGQYTGVVETINTTTGQIGNYWSWLTVNPTTGTNTERMRITSNGYVYFSNTNVGIGTATPTQGKLVITSPLNSDVSNNYGNIFTQPTFTITANTTNTYSGTYIQAGTNSNFAAGTMIGDRVFSTYGGNGSITSVIAGSFQGETSNSINHNGGMTYLQGISGVTQHFGSGRVTEADGMYFQVLLRNNSFGIGGNITNAYASKVQVRNLNNNTQGGYITNSYGLYVSTPEVTYPKTNAITNNYGIYLENMTAISGVGTSYAIYSNGGNSYIGGNITINAQQPIILQNTVWDDMQMPLITGRLPSTSPANCDVTFRNGTNACEFETGEQVILNLQMSHRYKLGSDIECHVHWTAPTNTTGNVTWNLEYTKADVGSTFGSTTTKTCTQAVDETAYTHQICDFLSIGNFTDVSGMGQLRLYRNSTDTYINNPFGLSVDCHIEMDTLGSASEYSKWS